MRSLFIQRAGESGQRAVSIMCLAIGAVLAIGVFAFLMGVALLIDGTTQP